MVGRGGLWWLVCCFTSDPKIINFNQTDGITMSDFIINLDPHKKVLLLLGGLSPPFYDDSIALIKIFVASAVGKIHKLRTAKLRELEAP